MTKMNCSWTINHVKKCPFLFGDFILDNFSVISLFRYISILIKTSPYCLFSFSTLLTDHISYPFKWFFCLSLLGLYSSGSVLFWIQISGENGVVAERHSRQTTFGKSEGGVMLYSPQILFSTSKVLLFFLKLTS